MNRSPHVYSVDPSRCIRCGACAVASGLFRLDHPAATFSRTPESPAEEASCEVAMLLCPVSAIRRGAAAPAHEERA